MYGKKCTERRDMDSIAAHNMIMYLSINEVLHLVLRSEHEDLELIVTRKDTSTSNGTENVSTSTLEERLVTLVLDDFTEAVEGGVVLDGSTGGHHHTTTDSVNGVGSKTSTSGNSPAKSEVNQEVVLEFGGKGRLEGVVHTEVETTVDDDTNAGDVETTVETGDTVSLEGLAVDIDETVELALTTLLGRLSVVSKTGTGIVKGVDEEEGRGTSGTTGSQVTGEPGPVTISVLILVEHALELVLEGKVQGLSREVTDDVSQVTSPHGVNTLILDGTGEAVANTLVGVGETTLLDHLILVLDEKLNTLDGSGSSLGDSGGDTTSEEVHNELVVGLVIGRHF